MIKILLASHGRFAEGIKNSLEIIMGQQDKISSICAYIDDVPFEDKLNQYMDSINLSTDKLIILTDIFGGSVNQKVMEKVDLSEVKVITGMNLPLLLELSLLNEDNFTDEKLNSIVNTSKEIILYVNNTLNTKQDDDFDF